MKSIATLFLILTLGFSTYAQNQKSKISVMKSVIRHSQFYFSFIDNHLSELIFEGKNRMRFVPNYVTT